MYIFFSVASVVLLTEYNRVYIADVVVLLTVACHGAANVTNSPCTHGIPVKLQAVFAFEQ